MKKIKYSLQRVLTLKEKTEEMLRQELSRLLFKRNQHEHVKFYYENALKAEHQKIREQTQFVNEDRQQAERHTFSIRNHIYHQDILMKEYDTKIEKKRQEILENRKEIKTMERLKERQLDEYNYEVMIDERRTMDEIASRISFTP